MTEIIEQASHIRISQKIAEAGIELLEKGELQHVDYIIGNYSDMIEEIKRMQQLLKEYGCRRQAK